MKWKPEFAVKPFAGKAVSEIATKAEKKANLTPIKYEDWAVWFDNRADVVHGYVSLPEGTEKADMPERITINCVTYRKEQLR